MFLARAKGAEIFDVDGNKYVDYHLAFGPVVLGHAHPRISAAVKTQLGKGTVFGLCSEIEVDVAKKIRRNVPSAEMVRFCNTGTEATYHAIRVARAYTKREKILKFEGAYHGWHDYVSVSTNPTLKEAGPRKSPASVADGDGLVGEIVKNTIVVPFNDAEILENTIKKNGHELAAVITEPILHGNATCILPENGFLELIRDITMQHGIVLIFDEVVTGFRHSLGGAQKIFRVTPDLTTFGKAMANGFPVAALCGKEEIMERFKPIGSVDYGGTFNANPIGMTATLATIQELEGGAIHKRLFALGEKIRRGFDEVISELNLNAQTVGYGSIFQIVFTDRRIREYRDTLLADTHSYLKFQEVMMNRGFFLLPHANKRLHLCAAHTEQVLDMTIESAREVLSNLKRERSTLLRAS